MILRIFFLMLALCSGSLLGKIEDHLKKAHGKSGSHKMENIDFIYTINLDERPEKFKSCRRQLRRYGIYPYRFSAVNGWKLSLKVINDMGVQFQSWMTPGLTGAYFPMKGNGKPLVEVMKPGRMYFCYRTTPGTIGCMLSHLSVLQDALDSGYKTIWVMEDDILILQNPHLISNYINKLDLLVGEDGWDILFTDQDTIDNVKGGYQPPSYEPRPNFTPSEPDRFAKRTDVSKDFRKIGARYGTYSMIIRRSGIKKILSFIKKYQAFLPIDNDIFLVPKIRLYTVIKDIVSTQRNAPTDNQIPGYLNK